MLYINYIALAIIPPWGPGRYPCNAEEDLEHIALAIVPPWGPGRYLCNAE